MDMGFHYYSHACVAISSNETLISRDEHYFIYVSCGNLDFFDELKTQIAFVSRGRPLPH